MGRGVMSGILGLGGGYRILGGNVLGLRGGYEYDVWWVGGVWVGCWGFGGMGGGFVEVYVILCIWGCVSCGGWG